MSVSSQGHNDVRGLFLPSTGLIENSLFEKEVVCSLSNRYVADDLG